MCGWRLGWRKRGKQRFFIIISINHNLAEWLQALVGQIHTNQHLACTLCRCSAFQACQKIFHLHLEEISFFFWSDFVKNCDMMCQQSIWSSVLAAQLAAKHLKEGGVLTLTGAQPALSGTAGKTIQF